MKTEDLYREISEVVDNYLSSTEDLRRAWNLFKSESSKLSMYHNLFILEKFDIDNYIEFRDEYGYWFPEDWYQYTQENKPLDKFTVYKIEDDKIVDFPKEDFYNDLNKFFTNALYPDERNILNDFVDKINKSLRVIYS